MKMKLENENVFCFFLRNSRNSHFFRVKVFCTLINNNCWEDLLQAYPQLLEHRDEKQKTLGMR